MAGPLPPPPRVCVIWNSIFENRKKKHVKEWVGLKEDFKKILKRHLDFKPDSSEVDASHWQISRNGLILPMIEYANVIVVVSFYIFIPIPTS